MCHAIACISAPAAVRAVNLSAANLSAACALRHRSSFLGCVNTHERCDSNNGEAVDVFEARSLVSAQPCTRGIGSKGSNAFQETIAWKLVAVMVSLILATSCTRLLLQICKVIQVYQCRLPLDLEAPGSSRVMAAATARHPLDPLTATEIRCAAAAARSALPVSTTAPRFVSITLREPIKSALNAYDAAPGDAPLPPRVAEAILITPETGLAYVVLVTLSATEEDAVAECTQLPPGTQPLFTPDDCILAEDIVKADAGVQVRVRGWPAHGTAQLL